MVFYQARPEEELRTYLSCRGFLRCKIKLILPGHDFLIKEALAGLNVKYLTPLLPL